MPRIAALLDISARARAASARQKLPTTTILQLPAPQEAPAKATKTAAKAPAKAAKAAKAAVGAAPSASSVMVECFQDGKEIHVRVVSKGYHRDWSCQFPRHLRVAGALPG